MRNFCHYSTRNSLNNTYISIQRNPTFRFCEKIEAACRIRELLNQIVCSCGSDSTSKEKFDVSQVTRDFLRSSGITS